NNRGSRVRSELQERISTTLTTQPWFSATLANYNELYTLQQTFKTLEQSEAYRQLERQPARQAQFAQQIAQLNRDIEGTLQEHATLLSTLFIAELNKESQKLNRYLNQARFAMAQIYETLMSQRTDTP
ncbi:MAG: hypothetical protein FD130_2668, partial [Halothiobacillaceae bacterium]